MRIIGLHAFSGGTIMLVDDDGASVTATFLPIATGAVDNFSGDAAAVMSPGVCAHAVAAAANPHPAANRSPAPCRPPEQNAA